MSSLVDRTPGSRGLGDFEIVREIGRGGMGVVYEARQSSLNRKVALKVLGLGLGLTHHSVQHFRREAEAAARLHHTMVIAILPDNPHLSEFTDHAECQFLTAGGRCN